MNSSKIRSLLLLILVVSNVLHIHRIDRELQIRSFWPWLPLFFSVLIKPFCKTPTSWTLNLLIQKWTQICTISKLNWGILSKLWMWFRFNWILEYGKSGRNKGDGRGLWFYASELHMLTLIVGCPNFFTWIWMSLSLDSLLLTALQWKRIRTDAKVYL